jgi:alkanesulfonate monooxygenase SsuD/methylene tetrahydromethanopterin reductase-like flavin-dependent oxidoreductase (luciferase family)
MRNHGTDPRTRMRLFAERVDAIKAVWTEEEASYHGEFVDFERIWSWPKPAQRPHPPVLVGGNGPTVLERVLAFGDAWFPNYARERGDLLGRARELRARAERPIDFMVIGAPADAAALARLLEGSCRRAVHWLPSAGQAVVERALERWESAIAEATGEA